MDTVGSKRVDFSSCRPVKAILSGWIKTRPEPGGKLRMVSIYILIRRLNIYILKDGVVGGRREQDHAERGRGQVRDLQTNTQEDSSHQAFQVNTVGAILPYRFPRQV